MVCIEIYYRRILLSSILGGCKSTQNCRDTEGSFTCEDMSKLMFCYVIINVRFLCTSFFV